MAGAFRNYEVNLFRLKGYPVGVSESLEALDAFSVTQRKPSTCTAPQVPVASNSNGQPRKERGLSCFRGCRVFGGLKGKPTKQPPFGVHPSPNGSFFAELVQRLGFFAGSGRRLRAGG